MPCNPAISARETKVNEGMKKREFALILDPRPGDPKGQVSLSPKVCPNQTFLFFVSFSPAVCLSPCYFFLSIANCLPYLNLLASVSPLLGVYPNLTFLFPSVYSQPYFFNRFSCICLSTTHQCPTIFAYPNLSHLPLTVHLRPSLLSFCFARCLPFLTSPHSIFLSLNAH